MRNDCRIKETIEPMTATLEVTDLRMFAEGRDFELYRKLGAHPRICEGIDHETDTFRHHRHTRAR